MRPAATLAALALLLAACGGAPATVATPPAASTTGQPASASDEAKEKCRQAVRDQLKSPATAQFSGEKVVSDGDGFEVVGDVDSQNSFGAMLRSTFTCHTSPEGGTHAFVAEL